MDHSQWWLVFLAFVLGLVVTFVLMIRRVKREVPVDISVYASPDGASTTKSSGKQGRSGAVAPTLALVVAVAAGVALTLQSQYRAAPAAPTSTAPTSTTPKAIPGVAPGGLPGLLLPAQQVADLIGAADLKKGAAAPALVPDTSGLIAEKECISAWNPAQQSTYGKTGLTGVHVAILMADEAPMLHIVYQSAISYPTADAAQKFVADQASQWAACSGRTVHADTPAGKPPRPFTFGPLTNSDGILSMTETAADNAMWGCQRALAARSNVVVDVRVCRPDVGNQAVDVLNAVAGKLPR